MTVKLDHQKTISELNNHKPSETEEALLILEEETQRRKEDVQQRIEFISASLRAQGNTQIHKMLKTIRQLTVKEFCEAYNADTQKFLNQQKKNRLAGGTNDISRKRPSNVNTKKLDSSPEKRSKRSPSDEECAPKKIHVEEKEKPVPESPKGSIGPLFVHLNRQNHPKLSIQLDPELSIKELGSFTIDAPKEILAQLSSAQKDRVREQLQDLQNQLDCLKQSIL